MNDLLQRYHGDVTLALAAYNAGEERVDFYNGVPPYPETKDYISKVLSYYKIEHSTVPANPVEVQLDLITMKLRSERASSVNEE